MMRELVRCERRPSYPRSRSLCTGTLLVLLGIMIFPGLILAQSFQPPTSWQLGLRSTGYFYQTENLAGDTDNQFQSFQSISGTASGLANGRLTLRGSGRFANDLAIRPSAFETARWYTGYAEARVSPKVKARLGRQFLQNGVIGLTLDGAFVSYRHDARLEANLWGGSRAPVAGDFQLGDMGDDSAFGGRVALRPNRKWRVMLSAASRKRLGENAERPVGLEVITSAVKTARLLGRVSYDMEAERWAKVQVQGQWRPRPDLPVFDVQFLDRHPSIDAASWFSRFTNLKRIKVLRASARHLLPSRLGAELEFMGNYVGSRSSSRLGLAVLFPLGRAGYSLRLGDAGEESQFYGELRYQARHWLELEAQASVLTYALLDNAPATEERDLTSLAAGFRAQLRPGCRVVGQIQSLDNPYYSKDVRFLLGLDLSMARGTSNFGLGNGGWLQ